MISEDYVSFETAKLLKEKGFDEHCIYVYLHNGDTDIWDADKEDIECTKPTQQMAMKWLREVHNLFIEIQCYGCEYDEKAHFEYSFVISEYEEIDTKNCRLVGLKKRNAKSQFLFYEEAVEAAIKYCLENLI